MPFSRFWYEMEISCSAGVCRRPFTLLSSWIRNGNSAPWWTCRSLPTRGLVLTFLQCQSSDFVLVGQLNFASFSQTAGQQTNTPCSYGFCWNSVYLALG